MRFACLRYFNAAGATPTRGEDHDPEFHLIPIVLQVAMGKREKASIFGADYPTRDGTCLRDYIHVVDLAQAHILALGALEGGSRFYNLGNGEGFTVKEVIDAAREVTGKEIRAEIGPRRPAIRRCWLPPVARFAKNLDGCHSFPMFARSSKALGAGTRLIRTATRIDCRWPRLDTHKELIHGEQICFAHAFTA